MRREKVVVIQPGSYTLKFGLSNSDSPQEIPNIISYRGDPIKNDTKFPSDIAENEICYLRRKLLEERKLLKPLANDSEVNELIIKSFMKDDKDLYFEEIEVKEEEYKLNKQDTSQNHSDYIIGDSNEVFSRTYSPVSQGYLDFEAYGSSVNRIKDDIYRIWNHVFTKCLNLAPDLSEYNFVLVVSDNIRREELKIYLDLIFDQFGFSKCVVHQESVCTIFGLGLGGAACVIDLGHTKTNISCVTNGMIVPESRLCLPFGGFNVTKTLSQIIHHCDFPLNNIFEIEDSSSSSEEEEEEETNIMKDEEEEKKSSSTKTTTNNNNNNNDIFNLSNNFKHLKVFSTMKENHCFYPALLSQKELFQHITILHNSKKYSFHLGDPLVIPVMGYFNPLLFFPFLNKKDHAKRFRNDSNFLNGYSGIMDNSRFIDFEYVKFIKDGYTNSIFPSFQDYQKFYNQNNEEEEEEEEQETEKKHKKMKDEEEQEEQDNKILKNINDVNNNNNNKKKKKKTKNKRKRKKNDNDDYIVIPFHKAVIQSINSSGINFRKKRTRKKAVSDIDLKIAVVGGGSYLRGVIPKLQYLLIENFQKEEEELENNNKKKMNVNIKIYPDEKKKKEMNRRFIAWKGASLTPTFKTIKNMWIERDNYNNFGMKIVKKCISFILI